MRVHFIFLLLFVFLFSLSLSADDEMKRKVDHFELVARTGIYDDTVYTREEVEKAILKTRGDDSTNPVSTSKKYLAAVVDGFVKYAAEYNQPSILFVGMALKESEYRVDKEGTLGEKGILQVGKQGRRACREECGVFSMEPGNQICHGFC